MTLGTRGNNGRNWVSFVRVLLYVDRADESGTRNLVFGLWKFHEVRDERKLKAS